MGDGLEKEEAGQQRYLHQHHRISGYDVKKGNDIQDADRIENYISRASQGLFQKGKHSGQNRGTPAFEDRGLL